MKTHKTRIYSIAFGGDGVGKVDGKVSFVKYALPEEEVVFKVENETSSYIKGVVSELLTASPDRVKPVCRYYGACGGCQYQHLAYEKEIIYKKIQLEDLMRRFGGLQDFSSNIIASEDPYHYRGNITLHKGARGYGFYLPESHRTVPIEECAISSIGGSRSKWTKTNDLRVQAV